MFLSDEEKICLKQFREKIQDCRLTNTSDEYLVKWLMAQDYNVKNAEKMLRQSLEWRRVNGIDDILDNWTVPEVITKFYSMGLTGRDKFGCPLWVSAQGRIDMKGLMQATSKKELINYHIYVMEKSCEKMRFNQELCPSMKFCHISDMKHLPMKQLSYKPAVDFGMEQARINEAHYPHHIRRVFIINTPRLFTVLYNVLRPVLPPSIADKIRVFGCDKKEWTAALLEEIDADQLPACYGGTLTDPDGNPKCPSLFNMGGEVPKSYYRSDCKPVPKKDMKTLEVGARSKEKLEFDILHVHSVLRWEFMTEGGSIAFGVYRRKTENGVVDLVPSEKVESDLLMEEGQIICDYVGKYIVEFDNSFSLMRSKKVRYTIFVDLPPSIN